MALSRDGPAEVTPFKVHLKHDAVPWRAGFQRYAVDHRNCMLMNVKALEEMAPVMIFWKPIRMVIHCRYANSQVQPMARFPSILEVSMIYLKRVSWFDSLNAFKGLWHFSLESVCQEICSFLTEYRVSTPTRLIQRSTDSAHTFQAGMMEVFDGMVSVLIWIDDVLLFERLSQTIFKS